MKGTTSKNSTKNEGKNIYWVGWLEPTHFLENMSEIGNHFPNRGDISKIHETSSKYKYMTSVKSRLVGG